jgi:hypothetical protein
LPQLAGLYGNAYASTFKHIFPDIGLDKNKLHHARSMTLSLLSFSSYFYYLESRWHSVFNRKKWFDDFARSRGFDPLIASNWYKMNYSQLALQEVSIIYNIMFFEFEFLYRKILSISSAKLFLLIV